MHTIKHLILENITAFESLNLNFSPGVNVLIGANGTGKTHILKILYAACAITVGEDREKTFPVKIRNVFSPFEGRIGRLVRRQKVSSTAKIEVARREGGKISFRFSNHSNEADDISVPRQKSWKSIRMESAFIPVKEMLAHAPGFLATATKREISFDEIYTDIIKKAFLPKLLGPPTKDRLRLLQILQRSIDGKVVIKGETFFLKNKQGDLEFPLLAEGLRKISIVWLLIQNGVLLSGSLLFWDEPEANLNPALIGEVVEVILELQRSGVQIFIATHNYVLLKEFDLRQKNNDEIKYISLSRSDVGGGIVSHDSNSYADIYPNAILDTFSDLYKRDIYRALGGKDE